MESGRFKEHMKRILPALERLPYCADLLHPLIWTACYQLDLKNVGKAAKWLRWTEQQALKNQDLHALSLVRSRIALHLHRLQGFHRRARELHLRNLELDRRIGSGRFVFNLYHVGRNSEYLGDLEEAGRCYEEALPQSRGYTNQFTGSITRNLAVLLLCLGRKAEALKKLREAYDLYQSVENECDPGRGRTKIGEILLTAGETAQALEMLKEALDLLQKPEVSPAHDQDPLFVRTLSGLDEGLADPAAFEALCREFLRDHPQAGSTPFGQWYALAADPDPYPEIAFEERFGASPAEGWSWQDPLGESSYTVGDGLEIRAANGGEIWKINVSSPRLLRPVAGDFAVQTVCRPATADRPVMGGLLLWKNRKNFLTLERGAMGRHELTFRGCRRAEDLIAGRWRLCGEALHLRLERRGRIVRALCSEEGGAWLTLGQVELAFADPVEVGLFAVGLIERYLYPGAYPQGTAIRFDNFTLRR